MATAPTSRKLNLTRDQLAAFLTDQQQIRQFELLFSTVDTLQVIVGTDFEFQADNAAATANEALAQINALSQVVDLNGQAEALSYLAEISKQVQALESAPPFSAPPAVTPASPTTSVQFNNAGAFGGASTFTYNSGTDTLSVGNLLSANFTSAAQGLVPASGGGTTNFLRADGSFAAPPATAPAGSTTQVQFNNAGAFGANAAFTWSATTFTVGPAGGTVSINTVAPTSSQSAATLRFVGRNAAQANGNGGSFAFAGGTGLGTGQGGNYAVTTGNCTNGSGGGVTFTTGGSTNGTGGSTTFTAGGGGVQGGFFSFSAGNGTGVNGIGGEFTMVSGDAKGSGTGGNYLLTAGNNTDVVGSGGSFFLLPGYGGTTGSIYLQTPAGGDAMQVTDDGTSAQISFFGAIPVVKPTVTGSRASGAALQNLLTQLASLGLITDSTTI